MGATTYADILADERLAFAASIINSAYASDSLDRLGIQVPGSVRFYLPMEIDYVAGSERDLQRRVFGTVRTAEFQVVTRPDDPEYRAKPYAGEIAFIRGLRSGDVAVIDTPTHRRLADDDANDRKWGGVWGGLLTALSMSYGALGAIINGPIRDTHQIDSYFRDESFDPRSLRSLERSLGAQASDESIRRVRRALTAREKFPVFATGTAPTDSAQRVEAVAIGEPIEIGGVTIHDGDFVVADSDAQVIIPNACVRDVLMTVIDIDAGDKDVWADALTRIAGFHDDSIDEIVERHGGHL
ncbi:RraA family protein [Candidatus Poribacteria bacterium]|nr:RraA family protein [Candidatus Poribacteria bacterium]